MAAHDSAIPERTINETELAGDEQSVGKKLTKFIQLFRSKHNGQKPHCVIRAPGRVNLIGDHVDYHGFAVLPMAIENCIWLGCSFKSNTGGRKEEGHELSTLELANADPESYPSWTGSQSLEHAAELERSHQWQNYVLCGYHGVLATELLHIQAGDVLEHARQLRAGDKQGLAASCRKSVGAVASCKMLIDSDLPAASGLSSSSALVCASALATSMLLRHSQTTKTTHVDSVQIASRCSSYEHLVGTRGGGMDQAVIMTAQEGFAKYVEFNGPQIKCENVRLPKDTVWLVSHCGFSYPKASTTGFNSRVLETKVGAALIAKSKMASSQTASGIVLDSTISLANIKNTFYQELSLREIIADIRSNIFEDRNCFSVEEICNKLELTREQLADRFQTSDRFLREDLKDQLQLLNRCEHVFEEADRVIRFKSICDTTVDIAQLGQLMTQSHYSLRDKFECSHPALDKLVSVALDAGALGSRLTGAGWGGCIVSLVEASKRDTVMDRLREVSKFTFETKPQSGCEVYWID